MIRTLAIFLAAPLVFFTLSGCADASSNEVEVTEDVILLDVRTPSEFADGHLEGAQLLDFNSGELAAAIPQLDADAQYLVYCRSGNRSGQAKSLMEDAGFTDVTNLGSLQEAAEATSLPVIN